MTHVGHTSSLVAYVVILATKGGSRRFRTAVMAADEKSANEQAGQIVNEMVGGVAVELVYQAAGRLGSEFRGDLDWDTRLLIDSGRTIM